MPMVIEALQSGDRARLSKASTLIEELYTSGDEYAENLIYVGVLEALKAEAKAYEEELAGILGESSAKAFAELTY